MTAAKYTLGAICPKCGFAVNLRGRRIIKHSFRSINSWVVRVCEGSGTKATDADVCVWLVSERDGIACARVYDAERIANAEAALAEARAGQAATEAHAEWVAAQLAALGGES